MPTSRRSLSVPERWRDWRQRLRGDQDELLGVLANLTLPQKRTPEEVDQRVSRAAALCDAALFMLWLAGIASPDAGRRLQQREVNLIDLRPADLVTFAGSLTANGVADEALSDLTRREFDQCWHTEARFRKDLMAYLFRPEVYLERALQAQEDIRDLMLTMDDFSEFVEAAAAREVRSATSDPIVALGSLVSASLPRDTHIQRLIAAVNQQSRASWTALYQEALERYGKRLNDGLKVEDFTRMAAMLTEGALAHSRSDPADVTSADMLAGIQLIVSAFVARTDALADNGAAMADAATLDQYRRHLVLNEKLTADERTLRILQQAHLDAFAYSNLDVMLGDAFLDLPNYLSRLMNSRHGGLCYQLNYSLALVLRAVGFNIDYLWGTVSKERGQPGSPPGNHLGLLVTIGERKWLTDAGLGDGPREPVLLIPGPVQQGPFQYELIEEPAQWTLVHDRQGTFAEVTFSKKPVQMDAFRSPADEQLTGPDSGFLHTLAVMKRRKDEAHLLRGRVYEVTGEQCPLARVVASQQEWLELLGSQFSVYLGNISQSQQRNLWEKVCESHERWIENQGPSLPDQGQGLQTHRKDVKPQGNRLNNSEVEMPRDASRQITYSIRDVCRSDVISLLDILPHAGEAFSLEWLLEHQAAGKITYIAAWDAGMPVGQGIILWDGYNIPELREDFPFTPVIRSIEVIENYRGHGIGSAIVNELETRARIRGYTHTSLGVLPGNTYAEDLWKYLGYRDWGKGVFVTTTTYERENGKNLARLERFLPMRKHL